MPSYAGGCHCGAIAVVFETEIPPEDLQLRCCACSFCRRHGAVTATDPDGSLRIEGEAILYRFALRTADFVVCGGCGVYLAAVLPEHPACATLNVNVLNDRVLFTRTPSPAHYGEEDVETRRQRRRSRWTPAVLAHRGGEPGETPS